MRRSSKKILAVCGTRPEAIKLAPVVWALKRDPDLRLVLCATAQHRQMLDQMLKIFRLRPRYDLNLMTKNQTPDEVMGRILRRLGPVIREEKPGLVLVQGDTTTAAAAALSAFYHQVPVAHVEAGLRSRDFLNPYPEEGNRVLVDHLSALWFAPTSTAKSHLLREGLSGPGLFVTGNTVVDALQWAVRASRRSEAPVLSCLPQGHRVVLVTLHRRESFGAPLRLIFKSLMEIARRHPEVVFVYPVHPNPQVRAAAHQILRHPRILLCEPLPYLEFLSLMDRSYLILTDSGGLQEEAPSLHKPVLVLRNTTERPEILKAGAGKLVGTQPERIVSLVGRILRDGRLYLRMSRCPNPYGDGRASGRIVSAIRFWFGIGRRPPDWE